MAESEKRSHDLSDPRVREWIDQEYRRMTSVPIETGKVAAPPVTPSWDRLAPGKQDQLPDRRVPARRSIVKRMKSLLEFAAGMVLFAARFMMLLGVALVFAVRFLGVWIASEAETDPLTAAVLPEPLPYRWGKFFAGLSALTACVYVYFAFAVSLSHMVRVSMAGLAVLAGLQALDLWKKKRFGLIAFLILCIVALVDVIPSEIPSLNWGESGGALGPAVLYLGSLPYFLRRRSEFGRNQRSV